MIRLIASDIDGTLLHNGAAEIDPVIFEEIHRLKQKDILFCPASGRQYHSLRRLFAPGNPGRLLGKTVMERERALALAHQIMDIPECEVLISGVNTSYLCPKKGDVVDHIRYFVGNNLAILPTLEDMPEDIVKVSAYCPQGAVEVQPVLGPKWEDEFHHAIAGAAWLDFNLANKGTGLEQLCQALDVKPEEVMAFGDNFNDLPMLEAAGCPYIMDNAAPELREKFPNHCRRVEDVLRTL